MNNARTAVIALTVFAGSAWSASAKDGAAKASPAKPSRPPVVALETDTLKPETAGIIRTAEKECQCSKWETTYEETCVAWDGQGNCTKKETVRRRKCIEWDHCHDKA